MPTKYTLEDSVLEHRLEIALLSGNGLCVYEEMIAPLLLDRQATSPIGVRCLQKHIS